MKFALHSKFLNALILVILVWQLGPRWVKHLDMEGKIIQSRPYQAITNDNADEKILFPSPDKKIIAIFWATWCVPCKIEMNRLKKSVINGSIPKDAIIAINPFESVKEYKKFITKSDYPFTFIHAPEITQMLNIEATPTTILFDSEKISSMSTGVSLIGIWRAELFLNN